MGFSSAMASIAMLVFQRESGSQSTELRCHRDLFSLAKILDDLLQVILMAWRCSYVPNDQYVKKHGYNNIIYHTPVMKIKTQIMILIDS